MVLPMYMGVILVLLVPTGKQDSAPHVYGGDPLNGYVRIIGVNSK